MIKKSLFEDELITGMQRELQAHDKKQGMENLVKAADYLHSAVEILEEAGLTVQADEILEILSKIAEEHKSGDKHHRCEECGAPTAVKPNHPKESLYRREKDGKYLCHKCMDEKQSVDDQDAKHMGEHKHKKPKNPLNIHDPHTKGLTPEKQVKNLLHHGTPFNMADDGKADDLLNIEVDDKALEVAEIPSDHKDFEDES